MSINYRAAMCPALRVPFAVTAKRCNYDLPAIVDGASLVICSDCMTFEVTREGTRHNIADGLAKTDYRLWSTTANDPCILCNNLC